MSYTFITGLYGTGKTTLACLLDKICPESLCSFDGLYNYADDNSMCAVYNRLSDMGGAIMDAIPIIYPHHLPMFNEFKRTHHVQSVIVTYCTYNEWVTNRLPTKLTAYSPNASGKYFNEYTQFYKESFLLDFLDTHMSDMTIYYNTSNGSVRQKRPCFDQLIKG